MQRSHHTHALTSTVRTRASTLTRSRRPGGCVVTARSATSAKRSRRASELAQAATAAAAATTAVLAPSSPLPSTDAAQLGLGQANAAGSQQLEQPPLLPPRQLLGQNGIVAAPLRSGATEQQQPAAQQQQQQPSERRKQQQQQQRKKQRRAATVGAVAAAAAAVAAPTLALEEQQPEQQQQRRRRRRSSGSSSGGSRGSKGTRLRITPKDQDLVKWYLDATAAAEQAHKLAARGGARSSSGTLGAALRKPMQDWLDERLQYMGFESRPFPSLVPMGLPAVQPAQQDGTQQGNAQEGVERWMAEAASCSGGSIISHVFAEWAQEAEGNLPVLASQWHAPSSNLWEPRNAGQMLHECHAAHAYCGAADEHAQIMIGMYQEFAREVAGLPAVAGRRSQRGTLRGAAATYSLEVMVGGGRAVQVAASHFLADNYSRVLGACYFDADGDEQCLNEMGAGLQASALSTMALVHGDDAGLRLPPALAPVQAVIVPMWFGRNSDKRALAAEAERIRCLLAAAGIRAVVDGRRVRPGVRFGAADRRGATVRIELGSRDVAARTCAVVRRRAPGGQPPQRLSGVCTEGGDALVAAVQDVLDDVQGDMRWDAVGALEENIVDVTTFMELRDAVEAGKWVRGPWAGSLEDELAIQEETGASLRCIPLQQPTSMGRGFATCLYSGYQASEVAIFARAL